MEESFRVRVDKVFGSLGGPSSAAPWALSDVPRSSAAGAGYRSSSPDKLDLSDGSGEFGGLDCTLDYEEEEDEFDKVALGLEVEEYVTEVDAPPKPILKSKRRALAPPASSKRVRFHPQTLVDPTRHLPSAHVSDDPTLPDYLRNPTRYTRYALDEASNRDPPPELHLQPPPTFTPRNKPSLAVTDEEEDDDILVEDDVRTRKPGRHYTAP